MISFHAGRSRSYAATDDSAKAASYAIVHIEKIAAAMGCLHGKRECTISMDWRTTVASTGRVLPHATTSLTQKSLRSVDDWIAYPDQAREVIDGVLARAGRRIAIELLRPE